MADHMSPLDAAFLDLEDEELAASIGAALPAEGLS